MGHFWTYDIIDSTPQYLPNNDAAHNIILGDREFGDTRADLGTDGPEYVNDSLSAITYILIGILFAPLHVRGKGIFVHGVV